MTRYHKKNNNKVMVLFCFKKSQQTFLGLFHQPCFASVTERLCVFRVELSCNLECEKETTGVRNKDYT